MPLGTCWERIAAYPSKHSGGGKPIGDPFRSDREFDALLGERFGEAIEENSPCFNHKGQWAERFSWGPVVDIPADLVNMDAYEPWAEYLGTSPTSLWDLSEAIPFPT
eukprot:12901959-Prorocentrum_lima.AAC.1